MTCTFTANDGNDSFHQYALTDQIDPTPPVIGAPGVFSSRLLTGDADSGISPSNNYTLAVNFNGPAQVVNGVAFNDGTAQIGPGYSLQASTTWPPTPPRRWTPTRSDPTSPARSAT